MFSGRQPCKPIQTAKDAPTLQAAQEEKLNDLRKAQIKYDLPGAMRTLARYGPDEEARYERFRRSWPRKEEDEAVETARWNSKTFWQLAQRRACQA